MSLLLCNIAELDAIRCRGEDKWPFPKEAKFSLVPGRRREGRYLMPNS